GSALLAGHKQSLRSVGALCRSGRRRQGLSRGVARHPRLVKRLVRPRDPDMTEVTPAMLGRFKESALKQLSNSACGKAGCSARGRSPQWAARHQSAKGLPSCPADDNFSKLVLSALLQATGDKAGIRLFCREE